MCNDGYKEKAQSEGLYSISMFTFKVCLHIKFVTLRLMSIETTTRPKYFPFFLFYAL